MVGRSADALFASSRITAYAGGSSIVFRSAFCAAADTASDKIIFHGKSITGNGKDYTLPDHNVLAKSGRVYYNST